jgi:hypothetical protein
MIDRRRPTGMRVLRGVAPTLLCLSLSALACTSATRSGAMQGAGTGGASGGLDASTTAGNAAPPGEPSGAGAAAMGSGGSPPDSAVPNGPDTGVQPTDAAAAADATPPGAIDAAEPPPDAAAEAGQAPGCPEVLPEFDAPCFHDGLTCQYGKECCPDLAFCEYMRWTLLTHHCDACI